MRRTTKQPSLINSVPSIYGNGVTSDIQTQFSTVTTAVNRREVSLFDHLANANNGTTVETDLYSDTLAAGQFATNGDKVFAEYAGTFIGDATSTQRLKAYFGGSLIFDTGALSIGVSTTFWTMFVMCIRVSSVEVRCSVSLTTSFASLNAYAAYTKIGGLTLANTQIIKITGLAAGVTGASNQITASMGNVCYLSA